MKDLSQLKRRLHSLVVFRTLLSDAVVSRFLDLCEAQNASEDQRVNRAADFIGALFQTTDNLTEYVLNLVLDDENAYILRAGEHKLTDSYRAAVEQELDVLQAFATVTPEDIRAFVRSDTPLPAFVTDDSDFKKIYADRVEHIGEHGYGIFAKYHMFCLKDGKITPVKHPDEQRLSDFSGYELERSRVIDNTKALLKGSPCNNVLLYGDAGSGKSSTVKAIANEFKDDGLRLIEVKKHELFFLPDIMDALAKNPLKFIIFIDDLSFASNDNDFGALKAILEGSVSGRSQNIAIYATSNRRHLIKENFSDREGDDLHLQDTIQEMTSLSARFGLKVTFSRPDKSLYCSIVCDLAKQRGIEMPEEELIRRAEAHALRNGGRSPRTARQFIDYLAYSEGK